MKHKNIDEIKKLESLPKIIKLFSDQEIKNISELYNSLPVTVHNQKQNIIKKRWLQNYSKSLDTMYISKLKEVLGEFKMDNFKSEKGEDFFGLFHESFSPLKLHVDSGFEENDIIFKQAVTPLSPIGETVIFKNKWYGKSTSFTIDEDELKINPGPGQNERSCEHLGTEEFDKEIYRKYLTHIDINNLKGLKVELIYKWKVGETLIMDRSHLHCSSTNIVNKKLGLTTFTKKN
tara:strand:- start:14 stop:712 length:699 start_codon:yes stop_codon:yes gene_type:complete